MTSVTLPWRVASLPVPGDGEIVDEFLKDLTASDCSPATLRSYGHDLLRWWRFLAAVGVRWDVRGGRTAGRESRWPAKRVWSRSRVWETRDSPRRHRPAWTTTATNETLMSPWRSLLFAGAGPRWFSQS